MKTKHQKLHIAMTLAAIAFTVNPANAAVLIAGTSIGVDFGPTAPTNFFNTVSSAALSGSIAAGALVSTTNVVVDGVGFTYGASAPAGGTIYNNDDSLEYAAQPSVFNDSNTTDWIVFVANSSNTAVITLTFTGLNDLFTYNLVIGSRFGVDTPNTSWTVDGQTLVSDATSDTNAFRSFTGLSTNGSGSLVMTGTGVGSRIDIAAVSALHLTAVPEPSAALLGGLGLLALLRRRR